MLVDEALHLPIGSVNSSVIQAQSPKYPARPRVKKERGFLAVES
jgi:hypothetical protein